MNRLVQSNELKTDYWREISTILRAKPIHRYDDLLDTLFIYFTPRETDRIITHYVDYHVAFLYRHKDKEIIGMRIEGFRQSFLRNYANKKDWKFSDSGENIEGIKDVVFIIKVEQPLSIPTPIEQGIELEPVFA